MGWTSYHAQFYKENGEIDRKAECDHNIESGDNLKVLKSSMVGSTYYAAVQILRDMVDGKLTPLENGDVFACIFLTSVNNDDYYNFAFKDMDETEGPYYYDCPKSILKLLTPNDKGFAQEWRKKCYENLERKSKFKNLPLGTRVRFELNGKKVTYTKVSPRFQFKRPFWYDSSTNTYIPAKDIPMDCEICLEPSPCVDNEAVR